MRYLAFALLVFSAQAFAQSDSNEEQVAELCQKFNGRLISQWQCPQSRDVRRGTFCELELPAGHAQVFNGCTGSIAGLSSIFFKACVLHDFCYHNEPAVSGKNRADCDLKFLNDMETLCAANGDTRGCLRQAETLYGIVRTGGRSSWACAKNQSPYVQSLNDL